MSEWIKTSNKRPTQGRTVLCFWSPCDGVIRPGCFGTATFLRPGHWANPEDDVDDYAQPDYWMLLPEPPKD